jgi:hypothetical protein
MQPNELLKTILSDYVAELGLTADNKESLDAFCAYANTWFQKTKPVGLGHTLAEGVSIRFADGSEFPLYTPEKVFQPFEPQSVGITSGSGGSVRAASAATVDSSLSITGNT